MERDTSIGIRTLGAVLQIAFHGTTDSGQLATNLVVTSGLQIDFQKRIMFAFDEGFIGQHSQFGFFGTGFGDKALIERLIAREASGTFGHPCTIAQ